MILTIMMTMMMFMTLDTTKNRYHDTNDVAICDFLDHDKDNKDVQYFICVTVKTPSTTAYIEYVDVLNYFMIAMVMKIFVFMI